MHTVHRTFMFSIHFPMPPNNESEVRGARKRCIIPTNLDDAVELLLAPHLSSELAQPLECRSQKVSYPEYNDQNQRIRESLSRAQLTHSPQSNDAG